jgi:uncharacterized protein (DUF2147 family)
MAILTALRKSAGVVVLAIAASATGALAQSPEAAPLSPIEGVWASQSQTEITIAPCEAGYCGTISRIVVPEDIAAANKDALASMSEDQFFDAFNKDPALRTRPIKGLQILTLKAGDKPYVFDGDIYNPQDGNTYSGYMEIIQPDLIRLNGCVLYNLICKGEDWTRVPTPPAEEGVSASQ